MRLVRVALLVAFVSAVGLPSCTTSPPGVEAENQQTLRDDAIARAEHELAVKEKALGPDHPGLAASQNDLAWLYYQSGDPSRAEPLYESSLEILENELGPYHPEVARTLEKLAELYDSKGDYARAKPLFERGLAITVEALGPEHPDVADSLSSLAAHYQLQGDIATSEPLYERALEIREDALGPDHLAVASSLEDLASVYRAREDYWLAELLQDRALAISEKALGPKHPSIATSLTSLADLYWTRRDPARAEPLYERALAIRENAFPPDHPAIASSLHRLSSSSWSRGDLPRAESLLLRASEIEERWLSRLLSTGSEDQIRAFMATLSDSTSEILAFQDASTNAPSRTRLGLTTVLRRKGRLRDLLLGGRDARRVAAAPVRVDDVQARIPSHATLVEIVEYRDFDPTRGEGAWGSTRLGAFLLPSSGAARWVALGDASATGESIGALRDALADRAGPEAGARERARDLDDRLIAPLVPHLKGAQGLLIAPDGVVDLVPFGELVDVEGRYLVERYELTYLRSGRDLLRPIHGKEPPDHGTGSPNPALVFEAPGGSDPGL
jgi:tetratricopeptide (TPR) repeat protein